MKKWKSIGAAFILVMALTIPLAASSTVLASPTQGLTPGYWKNHTEAWPAGVTPCTLLITALGQATAGSIDPVNDSCLDSALTMGDALTTGGGGLNAYYRQLAAAILNNLHPSIEGLNDQDLGERVTLVCEGTWTVEQAKDDLDAWNNLSNIDLGPGLQGKVKDFSCP